MIISKTRRNREIRQYKILGQEKKKCDLIDFRMNGKKVYSNTNLERLLLLLWGVLEKRQRKSIWERQEKNDGGVGRYENSMEGVDMYPVLFVSVEHQKL